MKRLLYVIFILICISCVSGNYYVDFHKGNSTPEGDCANTDNLFDNDWNTKAETNNNTACKVNFNYTILPGMQRTDTFLMIKFNTGTYNISINNPCWVMDNRTLMFRVTFDREPDEAKINCWRGSDWQTMHTVTGANETYEESLIIYNNTIEYTHLPMELYDSRVSTMIDYGLDNHGTPSGYTFNHGTLNGGIVHNSTGGYLGSGAYEFDGANDYINITDNEQIIINNTKTFTYSFWAYWKGYTDDRQMFISSLKGNGLEGFQLGINSGTQDVKYWLATTNGGTAFTTTYNMPFNVWTMISFIYNGSHIELYANDTLEYTHTATGNMIMGDNPFTIGTWLTSDDYFNGTLDNFIFWNRSLSDTEIANEYANQTKWGAVNGHGLVYSMIGEADYDNSTHAMDTNHMVSSTNTSQNIDLKGAMWFDGKDQEVSIPYSESLNWSKMTDGFSISIWFNSRYHLTNQWLISQYGAAATQRSVSLYYRGQNDLRFYTDSDTYVQISNIISSKRWFHVVAIYNGSHSSMYLDGQLQVVPTAKTLGTSPSNIIIGDNPSGSGPFNGTIDEVQIFDETLQQGEIQDLFNFNDAYYSQFTINITSPINNSVIGVEDEAVIIYYNLTTSNNQAVNCSLFRESVVINFSTNNLLTGQYNLTDGNLINGTKYYEIRCNRSGIVESDINNVTVRWSNFNVTITSPTTGTNFNNSKFNISYIIQKNDSINLYVNCSLYRNNSLISTQLNRQPHTYYNFSQTLSSNQSYVYNITCSSVYNTNTSNAVVVNMDSIVRLVVCGAMSQEQSLNFTIKDSINLSQIPGGISGFFSITQPDGGIYYQNLSHSGTANYTLCIYPETANTTVNAQIEYTAPSYEVFTFYLVNNNLDNQTDNIDLLLTPNSNTTLVTFTVVDENDEPVPNAYIYVLKYNLSTNSSILSEVLRTDYEGAAIGHIVLNTQRYRFLVIHNGELKLESTNVILLVTSYKFTIALEQDFFVNYLKVLNTQCIVSYVNSTNTFIFSYVGNDSDVVKGCLVVTQRTALGDSVLYEHCETQAAADITYSLGASPIAAAYIGQGLITIEGIEYLCDDAYYQGSVTLLTKNNIGLFSSFSMILVVAFISALNPLIAVLMVMVVMVIIVALKIYYMTWSVLISFIVIGGITLFKLNKK